LSGAVSAKSSPATRPSLAGLGLGTPLQPRRKSSALLSVPTPQTSIPPMATASGALTSDNARRRIPSRRAFGHRERVPHSTQPPSRKSSPTTTQASRLSADTTPDTARIVSAIGRSKAAPSLRRLEGARFTITFFVGNVHPLLRDGHPNPLPRLLHRRLRQPHAEETRESGAHANPSAPHLRPPAWQLSCRAWCPSRFR
jgi:hypothetical protein